MLAQTCPFLFFGLCFSPTADSFGVSAQIGCGVVRGGPEVRFHQGSTRFCEGCGVVRALTRAPNAVGDITELIFR